MEKFKTVLTMLALAGLVVFSSSGFAARGGTPGPPTDGGGGGASDLGHLIVLYRDAWGAFSLRTFAGSPWRLLASYSKSATRTVYLNWGLITHALSLSIPRPARSLQVMRSTHRMSTSAVPAWFAHRYR